MTAAAAAAAALAAATAATTAATTTARRRERWAQIGGAARARLTELEDRLVVDDLYGAGGAEIYHDLASNDTDELRQIISVVRRYPGAVCDLAAGSGRFTLPLLALGRDVTAVDMSPAMLSLLRDQLAGLPESRSSRATLVRGDMAGTKLPGPFGVVLLGATSISLLEPPARPAFLQRVHDVLDADGAFLVSALAPLGPDGDHSDYAATTAEGVEVYEWCPPGATRRGVTVVPPPPPSGPVQVYFSNPVVIPADVLTAELTSNGFKVLASHPVPGATGTRHEIVLLEAVRS